MDRVVEQLRELFAQVAELLADAAPDILAFTAAVAHWQKLWSNNPGTASNRERSPDCRGGHLPQPAVGAAPGGRGTGRATRRMGQARRYLTIPNAAGNEALPTPNMLDAAA